MSQELPHVLAFDVFGTVVDWHSSIARKVGEVAPEIDGAKFARAWRRGYIPGMQRAQAAAGDGPWKNLDILHREILDSILPDFGLEDMSEADRDHLTHAWHRLDPWPHTALTSMPRRTAVCRRRTSRDPPKTARTGLRTSVRATSFTYEGYRRARRSL